jgi:hypothetical protein
MVQKIYGKQYREQEIEFISSNGRVLQYLCKLLYV